MDVDKQFTLPEAHRFFAIDFHGKTWDLLEKKDRTPDEDALMIDTAHASCRHWLEAGTGVNLQRGEWLIARVYNTLGNVESAMRHALRCMELTDRYADLMEDFDRPFALEALARAYAAAGSHLEASDTYQQALNLGKSIKDDEDRKIFMSELEGGNWYGSKPD